MLPRKLCYVQKPHETTTLYCAITSNKFYMESPALHVEYQIVRKNRHHLLGILLTP
jgi:hypothetical protein